DNRRDTNL
ncbi:polymer-forming cytoskeletal family protein, partial [Vibrio harveyi]